MPLSAAASLPAGDAPTVSALSAVLMTGDREVLYEKEADRLLPVASTTKLMTALVVLESCGLEERVEIQPACCGVEGSSMYLKPGESYTVRELLLGLLLVSGNDAAAALACHCAGSIEAFSERMNRKAEELGMRSSHFLNPHGLNEAGHYSTARDMALLMAAAMENADFSALIAQPSALVGGQTLVNHNKLLQRYPGCVGGKTGYTQVAGRCLVSCVEREGLRLICVTLNDPDDWNSHCALYDWAFSRTHLLVLNAGNTRFEVPLLSGGERFAVAVPAEEVRLLVRADEMISMQKQLPFYVFAPTSAGAEAGQLLIYANERLLADVPLVYEADYALK